MVYLKYIGSVALIAICVMISFAGIMSIIEGILKSTVYDAMIEIIAGLLTIAIGLYLGKMGLKLFRKQRPI